MPVEDVGNEDSWMFCPKQHIYSTPSKVQGI